MEEFLNKLYSYDYFGIYLIISIIVLVLLFIIILFYGKKDQKKREIEATKKLQQISGEEAFKEENTEEKVEVNTNEKLENDTIIVPTLDQITDNSESINLVTEKDIEEEIPEPILPVNEDKVEDSLPALDNEVPLVNNIDEKIEEDNISPIFDSAEEKPLVFDNLINEEKTNDTKVEEVIEPTPIEEMEVPVFNFEDVVKSIEEPKKESTFNKGPEIFSSVYVPPKKEEVEIPKEIIKPKEEVEIPVPSKEELDFELPVLKKNVVKEETKKEELEMPVLNDYNLDELSGETYTINK